MPSLDAEQGFEAPMWQVSLHLARTKRVSVAAPDLSCSGTAASAALAQLAMNATAVSKSVQSDQVIAYCATNLVVSWYKPAPSRASPWLRQKEIKSIIASEARATNGETQQGCNTKP